MRKILPVLLIWLLVAFSACTKRITLNPQMDYNYFPLKQGHTLIYKVDSVKYSPLYTEGRDTFHWEMKEVITDSFTDGSGRKAWYFVQYTRKPGSTYWSSPREGVELIDGTHAERMLNNIRLIPLIFPPQVGAEWNGAAYIPADDTFRYYQNWNTSIKSVNEPYLLDGTKFDSTLLVQEVNDENLLEYRNAQAIYARNVGMIAHIEFNLEYIGSVIPDGSWEEKATNGFIVKTRLISVE